MALVKRILLFILSIVFIIFLLIGATTSYAEEKSLDFSGDITIQNFQMYDVRWIYELDKENKPFVCGTRIKSFDFSGRKYMFSYYLILLKEGNIVIRFNVEAIQISIINIDPLETEDLPLKIYAAKMSINGKDRFGGTRSESSNYKSLDAQFHDIDIETDLKNIKSLYKGDYIFYVNMIPGAEIQIPIIANSKYNPIQEKKIDACVKGLLDNHREMNRAHGEVFSEEAYRIG